MARNKQSHKNAGVNKKPKRSIVKTRKRDPTPEPSHPDNPCPTQVIGDGPGCNLCFPDRKCKPGERQVCRRAWADDFFISNRAVQLCRQQQQQLEEELRKLRAQAYCTERASVSKSSQTPVCAIPEEPVVAPVIPAPSRKRTHSQGTPRQRCRTCNALIDDIPNHQVKRRNSNRIFYQGAWQEPHQSILLCSDCRINGGPGTSRTSQIMRKSVRLELQNNVKREREKDLPRKRIKRVPENVTLVSESSSPSSSASCSSDENLCVEESSLSGRKFIPVEEDNIDSDRQGISNATTGSEASSEDEGKKSQGNHCHREDRAMTESNLQVCDDISNDSDRYRSHLIQQQWNNNCPLIWESSEEQMQMNNSLNVINIEPIEGDWRSSRPTALAQFQYLLDNQLYVDCCLFVSFNNERHKLPCHKLLLARASSVFADMLYEGNSDIICIDNLQPHAVELMLKFIYSDRVSLNGVSSALSVCAVAHRYRISALIAFCCSYIARYVTPTTACQALKFAVQYQLPAMQESCLKMVRERTEQVLESSEFLESERPLLELLLKQQDLNVSSELPLVNACENWARHQNSINNTCLSLVEALGPVRQLLRFLSLSASQFAQGPALSDILSQEEKLAIFVALASYPNNKELELPGGLSTDRRPRGKLMALQHDFLQSD